MSPTRRSHSSASRNPAPSLRMVRPGRPHYVMPPSCARGPLHAECSEQDELGASMIDVMTARRATACMFAIVWLFASAGANASSTYPIPAGAHRAAYPVEALRLLQEGDVIVAFTIGADGSVKNPSIVESSGNKALDDAALVDVISWRYQPTTKNEHPVAVPWKARVAFRLAGYDGPGHFFIVIPIPPSDVPPAVAASASGDTWLTLTINEDGSVGASQISRSSGSPALDQAGFAKAVGSRHFTAATLDGKPVPTIAVLDIQWPTLGRKRQEPQDMSQQSAPAPISDVPAP